MVGLAGRSRQCIMIIIRKGFTKTSFSQKPLYCVWKIGSFISMGKIRNEFAGESKSLRKDNVGEAGAVAEMESEALSLDIRRIVTDSDLDGVVTGAILRRWWPDAEVVFGHPGELRAGLMDDCIDRHTAVCDLPRHPNCGLSIDHHQSNAPTESDDDGVVVVWRQAPSAARIAVSYTHLTLPTKA